MKPLGAVQADPGPGLPEGNLTVQAVADARSRRAPWAFDPRLPRCSLPGPQWALPHCQGRKGRPTLGGQETREWK